MRDRFRCNLVENALTWLLRMSTRCCHRLAVTGTYKEGKRIKEEEISEKYETKVQKFILLYSVVLLTPITCACACVRACVRGYVCVVCAMSCSCNLNVQNNVGTDVLYSTEYNSCSHFGGFQSLSQGSLHDNHPYQCQLFGVILCCTLTDVQNTNLGGRLS